MAVKEDAKSRLLTTVRNCRWAAISHVTAWGFSETTRRFRLASRCGRGPIPTFFFFLFNWLHIHNLSPELLSLWISTIHFATKQVETNLHGNFLLQNEFDVSGGGGGVVPLYQPTRFSILLMILFRAKVWLITEFEHLPWPCCDFACANKSTRKTARFCLWLIYCIVLSRLSSPEQRANTPCVDDCPEWRNLCHVTLGIFFQKSQRLH